MRAHAFVSACAFLLSCLVLSAFAPHAVAQTRAQPGVASRAEASAEFAPRIGKLVRGRCHDGQCEWFSLEAAEFLGASEVGWLMKLDSRWWRSQHPDGFDKPAPRRGVIDPAGDDRSLYVFCSKTQPAALEASEGAWRALRLAPAQPKPEAQTRLAFYLAACHNATIESLREGEALARKLGYKGGEGGADSKGIGLARPQDVLTW